MRVLPKFIINIIIAISFFLYASCFSTSCFCAVVTNPEQQTSAKLTAKDKKIILTHAISFHDTPKYPENFSCFDYVNPNAPKQGILKKAVVGTYDSFNTFITKGVWETGAYFMYDALMVKSGDEPYTVYGLIATKVEYPEDFSWIIYHINPEAKFQDGVQITAEDVAFSFNALITRGALHYKNIYNKVKDVKIINKLSVKFTFHKPAEKSLVLRLSRLRILPKHYWSKPGNDLSKATLIPPVASGPYKIKSFEQGKSITYELVPNYWARDLPVNKGKHNFKQLYTEYYRTEIAALEAFRKGDCNIRIEQDPKNWKHGYEQKNTWIKEAIYNSTTGVRAFVFNIRKPVFNDIRIRKAISLALDFNWLNKHLFYGVYSQAYSIFNNSELAATGLPSAEELQLLNKYKQNLPIEVFSKEWQPSKTDGSGNWRQQKLQAYKLLQDAGYHMQEEYMVDKNGNPLQFEILLSQTEFERFVVPFALNLKELGIKVKVTSVDTSRYLNRIKMFDYDMIIHGFFCSTSPTTELSSYWSSDSANQYSNRNMTGISINALDDLIKKATKTKKRNDLINIARAMDRIILWNYVIIPQWFQPYWPMIYTKNIKHATKTPKYESGLSTWWWED